MPSTGDDRSVVWLDDARCWDLLRSRSVGRVAVERPGRAPLVVPVAYTVTEAGTIVFRTAPGSKVEGLLWGPVAFQVDEIDGPRRTGWSVLVEGQASFGWADLRRQDDRWVSWYLPFEVTVTPRAISGREVRLEHPETDRRGYR